MLGTMVSTRMSETQGAREQPHTCSRTRAMSCVNNWQCKLAYQIQ